jgi:serine acetyltransferase
VIGTHSEIETTVTVIGKVDIGFNVKVGRDCILDGPLVIENDVCIFQGVAIGTHITENALQPIRTVIKQGVRIGREAVIYARIELQDAGFVQAHSHLKGDLPEHCLAEDYPAALRGFICPC